MNTAVGTPLPDFRLCSVAIVTKQYGISIKQTRRSTEQSTKPRNKPMHFMVIAYFSYSNKKKYVLFNSAKKYISTENT